MLNVFHGQKICFLEPGIIIKFSLEL